MRPAPSWLETEWTLSKFDPWDRGQAREDYRRFVADGRGASYKPWESLVGQIYLGGESFCEMVQQIVDSQPRSRAHPRAQLEIVRPTLEHVLELVAGEFGETAETLAKKSRRPGRKAFAELAYRQCGLTQEMIAAYLGVSGPAVTKMIQTSEAMTGTDPGYACSMQRIRAALS